MAGATMTVHCNWVQDGEGEQGWDTGCGNRFMLNEGNPSENKMKFCCYCGNHLIELPWAEEGDSPEPQTEQP